MSDLLRAIGNAAVTMALLAATSACAQRPVGDLGRARPGVVHDEILPSIGKGRALMSGEPVSQFNLADEERELRDRVWRFLVAPHAHDWFFDVSVELQRTRLAGPLDHHFGTDRYFRWLSGAGFASSRVRYNAVADHVRADLDTMPATFRSVCAVLEIDRKRAVAAEGIAGIGEGALADARRRRAENGMQIDWFARAVAYRYESYDYALDHLLVETPHEEALEVDGLLSRLAVYVEGAQRGEYCLRGDGVAIEDNGALPSRVLMRGQDGQSYRK